MALTDLPLPARVADARFSCSHRLVPDVASGRGARLAGRMRSLGFGAKRRDSGCSVVPLSGEFDSASAGDLAARLAEAAAIGGGDLLVDLGDVQFMDASTIGVFVAIRSTLSRQGHRLLLRTPAPSARRLLDICGLAGLIERPAEEPSTPQSKAC